MRWGAFYQGLEECYRGVLVNSAADLEKYLNPNQNLENITVLNEMLSDIFVADFDSRHALHLSPQLRPIRLEEI
jgi:hypothetical protein